MHYTLNYGDYLSISRLVFDTIRFFMLRVNKTGLFLRELIIGSQIVDTNCWCLLKLLFPHTREYQSILNLEGLLSNSYHNGLRA